MTAAEPEVVITLILRQTETLIPEANPVFEVAEFKAMKYNIDNIS